jgi:uncharacterized protein (TIGR03435 family)
MNRLSCIACTLGFALCGLTCLMGLSGLMGQSPPPVSEPLPAFEVASIRPVDRTGQPGHGSMAQSGPRATFTGYTLNGLIMYAYDVRGYQVSGGPGWMGSDTYTIVAKTEGAATPGITELRKMLQSLLAERFELKLHSETKEMRVYLMEPARTGLKLTASKAPRTTMSMGPGHLTMGKATPAQMAALLSSVLNRPVLDRTGAGGEFDFVLESPDIMTGRMQSGEDVSGPSIFTAVEEQLGLKLESSKGPIETLIVDHVVKPAEN